MSKNSYLANTSSLRVWFIIHFILDMSLAIPLFFIPTYFLSLLGWNSIDPITSRLVAAAFFAIGIESFLARDSSVQEFKGLLNLKIIWSLMAEVGILISLFQNLFARSIVGWAIFTVFFLFNLLWICWRVKINSLD